MSLHSPGKAFRAALTKENPLQIVGTINANHALLAQRAGYQAIYLSGGGVAGRVRWGCPISVFLPLMMC